MRWLRLAPLGVSLTLALLARGCGAPQGQQSGIDADVAVVGGPTVNTQPHVLVTLTAQATAFSESQQVMTGASGVVVRLDVPPGRYELSEALGGDGACATQVVVVTVGPLESVRLRCDIR